MLPIFDFNLTFRELLNHSYVKGESVPKKELGMSRIRCVQYDTAVQCTVCKPEILLFLYQ
jgi:hypothetical protein